jgi:2-polyprenyl-3-methyl-5-hydroxy-6-metoxy-1,4-benzoquinol methylase
MSQHDYQGQRRYLGNTSQALAHFRETAESYPRLLTDTERLGLFTKPFDRSKGHASFFFPLYQILNMLRLLNLDPWAHVIEVGAGSGWVTEILLGLGYVVDAIEPSEEMIKAANERIDLFLRKHHFLGKYVTYHHSTLEELDTSSITLGADAVLFYESLHHIADEQLGLTKAFELLKPGGIAGIIGESNWQPDNIEQKQFLDEEIGRFGTLESPFTSAYLDHVLGEAGFTEITHYHGVNGFYPVSENHVLKHYSDLSAEQYNSVTAIRPLAGEERST